MVQYPIKISEENSKNSRFYGYLKLVLILSHFRARTLYRSNTGPLLRYWNGIGQMSTVPYGSVPFTVPFVLAVTVTGPLPFRSDTAPSYRTSKTAAAYCAPHLRLSLV